MKNIWILLLVSNNLQYLQKLLVFSQTFLITRESRFLDFFPFFFSLESSWPLYPSLFLLSCRVVIVFHFVDRVSIKYRNGRILKKIWGEGQRCKLQTSKVILSHQNSVRSKICLMQNPVSWNRQEWTLRKSVICPELFSYMLLCGFGTLWAGGGAGLIQL